MSPLGFKPVFFAAELSGFTIQNKLLDQPVFGNLEKPRVGRRDRFATTAETEAILAQASPQFRLIYSALRQCDARPGELSRATIADKDPTAPRYFVLGFEY
jgi:hypothetical protein